MKHSHINRFGAHVFDEKRAHILFPVADEVFVFIASPPVPANGGKRKFIGGNHPACGQEVIDTDKTSLTRVPA